MVRRVAFEGLPATEPWNIMISLLVIVYFENFLLHSGVFFGLGLVCQSHHEEWSSSFFKGLANTFCCPFHVWKRYYPFGSSCSLGRLNGIGVTKTPPMFRRV